MPITHDNKSIPVFAEVWDSSDRETIWISWADVLNGSAISASSWSVPSGWTNNGEQTNQTVQDSDGVSHANSNGVDVSIDDAEHGDYVFTNTVTFADGRTLERSAKVIVGEL